MSFKCPVCGKTYEQFGLKEYGKIYDRRIVC